ncbi:hypothetical protein LRS74_32050 [Streptomyces sp. LX-29]|uniref:hypothetical protein n=1 Tax=Streptomyces sp. LX-29 TaxID=2900152 RepID=UPI00240D0825|nr:hypothetical protein [Streptomyces sp. LX-29]WFB11156.1 hypothetical protein LRS74_32050 [Streptomyces sp. LX-29]
MSAPDTEDGVSVHLTDCGHEDAGAVFGALEAAFPEGAGPPRSELRPGAAGVEHPMVWCMTIDLSTRGAPLRAIPVPLAGPVTADLFGAADLVRRVKKQLAAVFEVEERGHVSGEHEMELRLRLTSGREE